MRHVLFRMTLAFTFGILPLSQSCSASIHSSVPTTSVPTTSVPTTETADLVAEEPNQDSLQMTCNGSILVNDVNFNAFFTREAGFSRIILRRRSSGQQIAETFLSFDRKNDKGQAIWRGSVNNAASVTLVHLSDRPAQSGDQVSVGYDGQWGRATCR